MSVHDAQHPLLPGGERTSLLPHQALPDVSEVQKSRVPAAPAVPKLSFKKRVQVAAASLLGNTAVRALTWSYRYRVCHGEKEWPGRRIPAELEAMRGPQAQPLLFALWHGTCFPTLGYWRDRGMCVVTSRSTDGQALARILYRLGFTTVNGSSSRGGTRALIDLARIVQQGGDAAIAVDGPRGPAEQVKPGIILLAKLTGRPIIPLATTGKRYWRFQSWDRFRLPFPFTKTYIMGGDPITVPTDADREVMEAKRLELENRLRQMQVELDAKVQPKIWKRADRIRAKKSRAGA